MSALDLQALRRALKTLQPAQGPLARRNARMRVVDALRNVRTALDKEYPAPPRKVTTRRGKLTVMEKRKALIAEGFVIAKGATLAKLAEAGVSVRYTKGNAAPGGNWHDAATWVPSWAAYYFVLSGISKVAEAKSSMTLIKAAKAAIRLGGFPATNSEIICPLA